MHVMQVLLFFREAVYPHVPIQHILKIESASHALAVLLAGEIIQNVRLAFRANSCTMEFAIMIVPMELSRT